MPFVNGPSRVSDSKNEMESRGFNDQPHLGFRELPDHLVSAWKHFESDLDYDADGTERPLLSVVPVSEEESRTLSEELRIEYTGDGPWEWMAGFFYFDEDARQDLNLELLGGVLALVPLSDLDVEAWALFGELSFNPTERLKLTAGPRYSDETGPRHDHERGDAAGLFRKGILGCFHAQVHRRLRPQRGPLRLRHRQPRLQERRLQLRFELTGVRPGISLELRGRAEGHGRRRPQPFAAARSPGYTDIQVRIYPEVTGAPIPIDNASKAEVKGLEVEGSLMPFDNFQLDLSIAYIDGSYKDYITGPQRRQCAPGSFRLPDDPLAAAQGRGAEYVLDLGGAGSLASCAASTFTAARSTSTSSTWIRPNRCQLRPLERLPHLYQPRRALDRRRLGQEPR